MALRVGTIIACWALVCSLPIASGVGAYDYDVGTTVGAEFAGTGSVRTALAHPVRNGYIRPSMVAFDATVAGAVGLGAYALHEAAG